MFLRHAKRAGGEKANLVAWRYNEAVRRRQEGKLSETRAWREQKTARQREERAFAGGKSAQTRNYYAG